MSISAAFIACKFKFHVLFLKQAETTTTTAASDSGWVTEKKGVRQNDFSYGDVQQFRLLTTSEENGSPFLILIKHIKETVSGVYLFNICIIEVI